MEAYRYGTLFGEEFVLEDHTDSFALWPHQSRIEH